MSGGLYDKINFRNFIMFVSFFTVSGCGFKTIETGNRGIFIKFGEIQGNPVQEGFYTYNPLTTSLFQIDVREQKAEIDINCFTKDTQQVHLKAVVTVHPDPNKIHLIYKQYGEDYDDKIIKPVVLGSVRDGIGRFIADDLVGKLESAKKSTEFELKEKLFKRDIILTSLDFTALDFDPGYKNAIESKVIAVQKAAESKNKTVEVEERAKQSIIAAEAEAKAMTIKSEALSKNKGLIEYQAVEKWNGVLPQYMMGSSVPFINLKKE